MATAQKVVAAEVTRLYIYSAFRIPKSAFQNEPPHVGRDGDFGLFVPPNNSRRLFITTTTVLPS